MPLGKSANVLAIASFNFFLGKLFNFDTSITEILESTLSLFFCLAFNLSNRWSYRKDNGNAGIVESMFALQSERIRGPCSL